MLKDIWSAFNKSYGPILIVGGIIISWLGWSIPQGYRIEVRYIVPVFMAIAIILLTLVNAYLAKSDIKSPRVLLASKSPGKGEVVTLLTSPSEFFSIRSIVSVYYRKNQLEVLIAVGIVDTIQTDGKLQIAIRQHVEGYEDIQKAMGDSSKQVLESIIIKPTIPEKYLETMI